MPITGQCAIDPVSGVAGDLYDAWRGATTINPAALVSGSPERAAFAAMIESIAAQIVLYAGGGGGGGTVIVDAPLTGDGSSGSHVALSYGQGLGLSGPDLVVLLGDGLGFSGSDVAVNYGTGLHIVSGALAVDFSTVASASSLLTLVPQSRQITAGTGLTGGGDLSADRTLNVSYGTTAGTAAQGNDSRITGALQSANNLSDVSSPAAARANLGLGTSATHATGDFLQSANNLSDVSNAGTARTNLGLGTAAVRADTYFLVAGSNLSDLANAGTARTNLGLGGAAVLNVGTAAGTVAAGDDSRIVNAVPNTRQVIAGTGLTGGGALSADRTLNVSYGTTAGTATQGNDTRLPPAPSAQGKVLYDTGAAYAALAAGTAGQALITGGAGANPSWRDRYVSKTLSQVAAFQSTLTTADTGLVMLVTDDAPNGGLYEWTGTAFKRLAVKPKSFYGSESWADAAWTGWSFTNGAQSSLAISSSKLLFTINNGQIQNGGIAPTNSGPTATFTLGSALADEFEVIGHMTAVTGTAPSTPGNWSCGFSFNDHLAPSNSGGFISLTAANLVSWGVFGSMTGPASGSASATFTSGNNWLRARYRDGRISVWYASQAARPTPDQWILGQRDLCSFGNTTATRPPVLLQIFMETYSAPGTAVTATWDQVSLTAL